MRTVLFSFRPAVLSEQQDAILAQINAWKEVHKAGHLKPDAKRPELQRTYYAYIEDNADLDALVNRLSGLPEVESAAIPAERKLQ